MKISTIQYKATFLLFVCSLSTIVGSACSLGLNMTFNISHHEVATSNHHKSHEHGKSHEHPAPTDINQRAVSEHDHSGDHHEGKTDHHKQVKNLQENPEDNCCKDEVAKFEKSDKRTPQSIKQNFQAPFVILPFNSLYPENIPLSQIYFSSNKHFVRNHHPPIADTRIAIQSFQI